MGEGHTTHHRRVVLLWSRTSPWTAMRTLNGGGEAETSLPGIVLAALSLDHAVPVRGAAQGPGPPTASASAVADSKQILLCTYLSAVLLVGLVSNATSAAAPYPLPLLLPTSDWGLRG